MTSALRMLLFAVAGFAATGSAAVELPRPASLEPAVTFWQRIYTEVPSSAGLIHDDRRLGIVYEQLAVPMTASWRVRRARTEAAKSRYADALLSLAGRDGEPANALQKRVRALFPESTSVGEFAAAAQRLRFQRGLADRFREGVVRSGRWLAHIRAELLARGVPVALAALPHVESSFNPMAYSHAGAAGMWQFTRGTGRHFMRVDHVVDERYDPWRASEAASRLLAANYAALGSWPLAITAYNHGVTGMRRAVATVGTTDIAKIIERYRGPYFGFASRNFYPALLAAAAVEVEPERFFGPVTREQPPRLVEVPIPDYTPVGAVERQLGIGRTVLRRYNPGLRESVWTGRKFIPPGYTLRLPDELDRQAAIEAMGRIPLSERYAEQRPDRFHVVGRGQTLSGIAGRYQVAVSALVAANGLRSRHLIRTGEVLRLPLAGEEPQPLAPPQLKRGIYVVQSGDTLAKIAQRFEVAVAELIGRNELTNPNRIRVGQRLQVLSEAEIGTANVVASGEG